MPIVNSLNDLLKTCGNIEQGSVPYFDGCNWTIHKFSESGIDCEDFADCLSCGMLRDVLSLQSPLFWNNCEIGVNQQQLNSLINVSYNPTTGNIIIGGTTINISSVLQLLNITFRDVIGNIFTVTQGSTVWFIGLDGLKVSTSGSPNQHVSVGLPLNRNDGDVLTWSGGPATGQAIWAPAGGGGTINCTIVAECITGGGDTWIAIANAITNSTVIQQAINELLPDIICDDVATCIADPAGPSQVALNNWLNPTFNNITNTLNIGGETVIIDIAPTNLWQTVNPGLGQPIYLTPIYTSAPGDIYGRGIYVNAEYLTKATIISDNNSPGHIISSIEGNKNFRSDAASTWLPTISGAVVGNNKQDMGGPAYQVVIAGSLGGVYKTTDQSFDDDALRFSFGVGSFLQHLSLGGPKRSFLGITIDNNNPVVSGRPGTSGDFYGIYSLDGFNYLWGLTQLDNVNTVTTTTHVLVRDSDNVISQITLANLGIGSVTSSYDPTTSTLVIGGSTYNIGDTKRELGDSTTGAGLLGGFINPIGLKPVAIETNLTGFTKSFQCYGGRGDTEKAGEFVYFYDLNRGNWINTHSVMGLEVMFGNLGTTLIDPITKLGISQGIVRLAGSHKQNFLSGNSVWEGGLYANCNDGASGKASAFLGVRFKRNADSYYDDYGVLSVEGVNRFYEEIMLDTLEELTDETTIQNAEILVRDTSNEPATSYTRNRIKHLSRNDIDPVIKTFAPKPQYEYNIFNAYELNGTTIARAYGGLFNLSNRMEINRIGIAITVKTVAPFDTFGTLDCAIYSEDGVLLGTGLVEGVNDTGYVRVLVMDDALFLNAGNYYLFIGGRPVNGTPPKITIITYSSNFTNLSSMDHMSVIASERKLGSAIEKVSGAYPTNFNPVTGFASTGQPLFPVIRFF